MIAQATKYADVRQATQPAVPAPAPERAPAFIRPQPHKFLSLPEWFWTELRDGGLLQRYIASEKRSMERHVRRTAIACRNFSQNNRSEFRRVASIPARLFFRWRGEDPDFWADKKNLKSLKRDNPELAIWT